MSELLIASVHYIAAQGSLQQEQCMFAELYDRYCPTD